MILCDGSERPPTISVRVMVGEKLLHKGKCSGCGGYQQVRTDGRLRRHGQYVIP